MARKNIVTVNRQVQDLVKGMVVMAGGRVFKIQKVRAANNGASAQITTRMGALITLPIDYTVKVRAYVKL